LVGKANKVVVVVVVKSKGTFQPELNEPTFLTKQKNDIQNSLQREQKKVKKSGGQNFSYNTNSSKAWNRDIL
jgi:hypothetical protein